MCPAAALPQPVPWPKERRKRPKYCFTAAMDEEIRHAYHLYVDHNNSKAIGSCARKLGLPKWLVTRRGGALGLARVKGRRGVPKRWRCSSAGGTSRTASSNEN